MEKGGQSLPQPHSSPSSNKTLFTKPAASLWAVVAELVCDVGLGVGFAQPDRGPPREALLSGLSFRETSYQASGPSPF